MFEDPNDPHWSGPAVTWAQMIRDHERRLDVLDEWRAEIRGAMALMRLAFGASILSAVVSVLAIAQMLNGGH